MKTTTKIIISLILFTFILAESLIAYTGSTLQPLNSIWNSRDNIAMISDTLDRFSSITIEAPHVYLNYSDDSGIKFIQNDSVTEPKILIPDNIIDNLKITQNNGHLSFYFFSQDEYRPAIALFKPITVITSQIPDSIVIETLCPIHINGSKQDSLFIRTFGNFTFDNSNIGKTVLEGANRMYSYNEVKGFFSNTILKEMEVRNMEFPLILSSDSISSIDNLQIHGLPDCNITLNPGSMRINNFSFYSSGTNSMISLTESSSFTTSFINDL